MSLSENLYPLPKKVFDDLNKEYPRINYYPIDCYKKLRKALAEYHELFPENIFISNGLDEMIFIASLTLANNHRRILLPEVMFQGYVEAAKLCGIEIISSKITQGKIDIQDLLKLEKADVDFVVLCNPMNPYGTILSTSECELLIQKAHSREITVIIDEAYGDFANKVRYKSAVKFIQKYDNVVIYKSFSKYYGLAGLRCGYAISNPDMIEKLKFIETALPFRVNRMACAAAISCLNQKREFDNISAKIGINKKILYKKLDENQIKYIKSETNFVLIYLDKNVDVEILCARLRNEYGILVKSGKAFGIPYFIRVGIGTREQVERFIEAFVEVYKEMNFVSKKSK